MRRPVKRLYVSPGREEYALHKEVVSVLRNFPDLTFWHTPNGAKRGVKEARALKAMGMRAGVPDLACLWKDRLFFLEIKAPGEAASEEQLEFIQRVADKHLVYTNVIWSIDGLIAVLKRVGVVRA